MKSPSVGVVGMVCAIVLSGTAVTPARATVQTNYPLSVCEQSDPPQTDLVRTPAGIATLDAVDTPRFVTCSVPYSANEPNVGVFVFVDGDNRNQAQTTCTLSSYDNSGVLKATQSFTAGAPTAALAHYEEAMVLSAQQAGFGNNYLSMTCLIPAHGNGLLRGAIVLQ